MQLRHLIGTLLLAWMIQACAPKLANGTGGVQPKQPRPDVPAPRPSQLQGEATIGIERSACGFRCPAYRVGIDADGLVRYEGRMHVAAKSARTKSVDAAAVARLHATLSAELPALAGEYLPGTKQCGQMRTDQPSVSLTVTTADGRSYRSRRYAGCTGAPPRLAELENMVDETAQTEEWVGGRALR